ncbi:MAG: hypothetical protein EHM42_12245 [Planctomycetaceae bacterium]|nr:MAG: hypothetical protein EHM42_12245 [Planctomycetaceae bacterium]
MSVSSPLFVAQGHPLLTWRLELLERLLIGVVPRERRLEIVAQTERRMDELLAELKEPQPTDEQLLQILARLDSPEAVLTSAGVSLPMGPSGFATSFDRWTAASPRRRPASRRSLMAAGLGTTSVGLVVMIPVAYYLVEILAEFIGPAIGEEVFAYCCVRGYLGLMLLTSAGACSTSIGALWQLRRRQGTHTGYVWATLGLIASVGPLALSALLSIWIVSELWRTSAAGGPGGTAAVAPPPTPVAPPTDSEPSVVSIPVASGGIPEEPQSMPIDSQIASDDSREAGVVVPAGYLKQAPSQGPDLQVTVPSSEERPPETPLPE